MELDSLLCKISALVSLLSSLEKKVCLLLSIRKGAAWESDVEKITHRRTFVTVEIFMSITMQ